jgi:acyl transferase domain-containing protein
MECLDSVVRERTGESVIDVVYHDNQGSSERFEQTLLTHPAVFMVQFALAQCLIDSGVTPTFLLGASLGAYVAAAIAGCVSATDMVAALVEQASLLESTCAKGGMIAILEEPRLYEDSPWLQRRCEVAAVNFPKHFVVAAPREGLDDIEAFLGERRVVYQRLPVQFAFHSQWIEPARCPFVDALHRVSCTPGVIPLVSCVEPQIRLTVDREYLWDVARRPILFDRAFAWLEARGGYRYIDVGPMGTLATFAKYCLRVDSRSRVEMAMSPRRSNLETLAAVIAGS